MSSCGGLRRTDPLSRRRSPVRKGAPHPVQRSQCVGNDKLGNDDQCPTLTILATITHTDAVGNEDSCMGMNVNLTPQLEDLVRRKVASGLYTSASEVVREALRLMDEQDHLRAARLEQLRNDIRDGLDSGTGEPWYSEATKRRARARHFSPRAAGTARWGACYADLKPPRTPRRSGT